MTLQVLDKQPCSHFNPLDFSVCFLMEICSISDNFISCCCCLFLQISTSIQIVELVEGEPCKFALLTSDNRINLKSSSVEIKQEWVRALRSTILKTTVKVGMENGNVLQSIQKDLMVPSPYQSPIALRKSKSQELSSKTEFDKVWIFHGQKKGSACLYTCTHHFYLLLAACIDIIILLCSCRVYDCQSHPILIQQVPSPFTHPNYACPFCMTATHELNAEACL